MVGRDCGTQLRVTRVRKLGEWVLLCTDAILDPGFHDKEIATVLEDHKSIKNKTPAVRLEIKLTGRSCVTKLNKT